MAAEAQQLKLMLHDHVVVPDGREGVVVGFYHCEEESVLVAFSLYGAAAKFSASDVELLIA
jgi:hypothetical protein